jgi:hypothetical protein
MLAHRNWTEALASAMHLFGHRNWIVIADSAYPHQTGAGIETMNADAQQIDVVARVLLEIDHAHHVRPKIYIDSELAHLDEQDAPGIDAYRERLVQVIDSRPVQYFPHEEIIEKIDEAGQKFQILVIKTNMTLPYTSVFLELDCGYWTAEAENRLRAKIAAL